MAPQTIDLPLTDDSEAFGISYAVAQFVAVPFTDGGVAFGIGALVGEATPGVTYRVGATLLDDGEAATFVDDLQGPGSWRLRLPSDDPDMPDFDDEVIIAVDGIDRFGGPVEGKRIVTHATGEEDDEATFLSGRGMLAITDGSLVPPALGLGAEPVEVVRTFSWPSVDFDDPWPAAKLIRRADQRTARFPNRYSPEWWPDPTAWWVWANLPSVSELEAPLGRCLFRSEVDVAEDCTIAILVGLDNFGTVYWDGARLLDSENDPSSYTIGRRITFNVTAGTHIIAANVKNLGRGGGWIYTVWTLDDEGLLDEMIAHSGPGTKCLGYPAVPPGFTATKALRIMVEEAQAEGELTDVVLDFTDTVDSGGQTALQVAEITVDVNRSIMEVITSLGDWLIDATMTTAKVLRVWNWGTRGGASGVTIADTTDPDTSETAGLVHDGKHVRANRLVIRYRRGYTEVADQDSIDLHGRRSAALDLGDTVDSEEVAQQIGERLLDLRRTASYSSSLDLLPVTSIPYETFGPGDTIEHTDETLGTVEARVRSLTMTEGPNGEIEWKSTTRDARLEDEDRQENWLRRMAMGSLAGGARVTSRSGEPLGPAARISTTTVATFSQDGAITTTPSPVDPAASSGNLIELYGRLTTPGSTSTEAEVYQIRNGGTATLLGTLTWAAGVEVAETDLAAAKCFRNVDEFFVVFTAVGTGAQGAVVQVRGI